MSRADAARMRYHKWQLKRLKTKEQTRFIRGEVRKHRTRIMEINARYLELGLDLTGLPFSRQDLDEVVGY